MLLHSLRYICLGGSAVPSPSDGSHGYRCPPGFHCPPGAHSELPCEPGTFSPLPGADTCLPCPGGTYCQTAAAVETTTCPKGNDALRPVSWGQRDLAHDPSGQCPRGFSADGTAVSPSWALSWSSMLEGETSALPRSQRPAREVGPPVLQRRTRGEGCHPGLPAPPPTAMPSCSPQVPNECHGGDRGESPGLRAGRLVSPCSDLSAAVLGRPPLCKASSRRPGKLHPGVRANPLSADAPQRRLCSVSGWPGCLSQVQPFLRRRRYMTPLPSRQETLSQPYRARPCPSPTSH